MGQERLVTLHSTPTAAAAAAAAAAPEGGQAYAGPGELVLLEGRAEERVLLLKLMCGTEYSTRV